MRYILTLCLCLWLGVAQGASLIGSGIVASDGETEGFVGNSCIPGTASKVAGPTADTGVSQIWAPTTGGTIGYLHVSLAYTTSSDTYNVAIYCAEATGCTGGFSDGDKMAESNLQTALNGAWNSFALDSSIEAKTDEDLKLVVGGKTDTGWRFASEDDLGNLSDTYHSWSLDVEDTMPSSVTDTGDSNTSADACIYGDNTE